MLCLNRSRTYRIDRGARVDSKEITLEFARCGIQDISHMRDTRLEVKGDNELLRRARHIRTYPMVAEESPDF